MTRARFWRRKREPRNQGSCRLLRVIASFFLLQANLTMQAATMNTNRDSFSRAMEDYDRIRRLAESCGAPEVREVKGQRARMRGDSDGS